MKKYFLLFAFLFSFITTLRASHYMGGEIWWECQSNGKYVFKLKVYQECYGINYQLVDSLHTNVPGIPAIAMYNISVVDITPICNNNPAFPHIICSQVTGNNQGGIREWLYASDTINLPPYAPPASGWTFQFTELARNNCTNILNNSSYPYYVWATMYPYNNQPANPCYDNSPVFAERAVFISPTTIPQSINNFGIDRDGDSLFFEWTSPRSALNIPITSYNPGYTFNSPLPGTIQNPNNIPAVLDPKTGIISFTSFTSGAFVTCLKSSSYRNGILIAEGMREVQWTIIPESTNSSPFASPPFPTNSANPWADTINFGDVVHFQMTAVDPGLLNDTFNVQSVSLTASGLFFGDNYSNANCCCPVPPCATLSPTPPNTNVISNTVDFNWVTNNLQLQYGYASTPGFKEFIFSFNYADDYCPFSARTAKAVSIFIRDPILPAPVMGNYSINSQNGQLTFFWTPVQDPNGIFEKYMVYQKGNVSGPYYLVDSIMDINQDHYSPAGSIVSGQFFWYYLKTKSLSRLSTPSSIITNYYLGLPDDKKNTELSVFFNTSQQCLTIKMNSDKASDNIFQLFDCLGVNHFKKVIHIDPGLNQIDIPIGIIRPGVYYYRISGKDVLSSGKIMIINKF